MSRHRLPMIPGIAAAAAIIGLAFFAWRVLPSRDSGGRTTARPDIVLITVDTLRADRVGRGLTPAIDALGGRGLRLTNVRATAPLTLPSHVSIMTGLLPVSHGIRENGAVFRSRQPTIAAELQRAGYRTAAFVGAYVLDRRFGLAAGFEHYDDRVARDPDATARLEAERKGSDVAGAALSWLQSARSPYFLWVHLYDPHAPYDPPADYAARAQGNPYDGEVAYVDAQVGRISSALAARAGATLVVIAGDHGEGLGEHDEQTHGMLAYDSTLRVPLVLSGAGVRPDVVHAPASLIDVAPTLLRRAGVSLPPGLPGLDLLGQLPADRDVYSETQYPRAAGWHPLAALTGERWKLLLSSQAELYDIVADPQERTDVAAMHTAVVHGMTTRLRQLEASTPAPATQVDPDAAARLRALGYVSAGATPLLDARAPNPARVITAWSVFETALSQVNAGHPATALPALKDLSSRFPSSIIFRSTYARALKDGGNPRAALDVYRAAVARHPGDAALFHDLAVAARAAGDNAEAVRAEQAALVLDKENPAALNGLGLLHADAGRPAEAVAAFARAADLDRGNPSYVTNLGNAHRERNDLAAAEAAYRRALEVDGTYPDALNGLGVLLVQRGRSADAVPVLERALQTAPDFHEARLNLGIAYQQSGDRVKAAEIYRQLLDTSGPKAARERKAAADLLRQLR